MEDNKDLYDEFGTYLGPVPDDESSSEEDEWNDEEMEVDQASPRQGGEAEPSQEVVMHDPNAANLQIVLAEDKKYYPEAEEVYPEAETMIQEEDTQPIETPIVAPVVSKCFQHIEKELPETTYKLEYLTGLMDHPALIRNIALIGHLHHGKTLFMDMAVQQTHVKDWDPAREYRYTDIRKDEQDRGVSIKAVPMSLVLPSLSGKSYLINMMDTPGHVNFSDEQTAALRVADGAVVVVDAAEGVMVQTERALRHAFTDGLPVVIVINKVDRLMLELKVPPDDAYHKLCHTLEEINVIAEKCGYSKRISPDNGNVIFASALYGWAFSLQSFAKMYTETSGLPVSYQEFAKRLWGNRYFSRSTRRFLPKPEQPGQKRSFVEFIMEPVYKMHSHILSGSPMEVGNLMEELGVTMKKSELSMDARPLLKLALSRFFGDLSCLVEAVVEHFPSPIAGAQSKVESIYTGDLTSECAQAALSCDSHGPLMAQVSKLYPRADSSAFDSFARVFSGTIRLGDQVRVLGEGYTLEDEEDMAVKEVTKIWIFQGRYRVEVNRVTAGNWCLLEGVEGSISKTATLAGLSGCDDACIFRPLRFNTQSVMRVAIEPINPSELPKMIDALRKVSQSYPIARTKVEDSGEHTIIGTGELQLDCMLHDLRHLYGDLEVKVSDPVVTFCETVVETSSLKCFAETANKRNKLTMIAEPLQNGIADDIENERVRLTWDNRRVGDFFQKQYGWDVLAARSIWAFGPDQNGPNILVDDTLPGEVDKKKLYSIKDSVVQGFQWAVKEGPLCDEPIRNVKFKLLGADIADEAVHRGSGQIIPTARRVANSAFLLATPKLMEPIYFVEIQAPGDCINAIYDVLARRRGHISQEAPKPGTPLFTVQAYVPVIDSFGFETDLRTHTMGQAFSTAVFDHWEVVPGDPLDKSIVLRPLEISPVSALAREFMVKTRRRKGLSEDVSINKFFDDPMLMLLAKQEAMM